MDDPPNPTPSEILEANVVLSVAQVAIVLSQVNATGKPRKGVVHGLIRDGAIRPVDPEQPIQRLTVSRVEVKRYIQDGPRQGVDRVPWNG